MALMDSHFFLPPTSGVPISPNGSVQSASIASSSPSCDETPDPWNSMSAICPLSYDLKTAKSRKGLKPTLCCVCANEPSTVSYFGSRICTGCRAFFRRSVKSAKTYQCLNSELCGNGPSISNRLACKFCRFQRCVNVGMLDKKLQLHSDRPERRKENAAEPSFPLIQLDVFLYANLAPILGEFSLFRRQICFERYSTYHGKDTKVTVRPSGSALHDWFIGMYEYDLLDTVGRRSEKLFGQFDPEDWEELLTADFSMINVLFFQCLNTSRNGGRNDQRFYLVDESYLELQEEKNESYWLHVYEAIPDEENRNQIYQIVRQYFLLVSRQLVNTVSHAFDKAKLDDTELSALLLLLFTNPSSLSVVSDSCRQLLRQWKEETLRGIGEHIERTGRNVDERMAEIVFLLAEFQSLILLAKNAVQLSLAATKGNSFPQKFRDLIDRSNNRRMKSRVMQRLFGDLDANLCPVN